MLKWRMDEKVDDILLADDVNEAVYQAICPHKHHRFDKQGRPVYMEKTGVINMPLLLKHVTERDLVVRHVRSMEQIMRRMKESSKTTTTNVEKQVVIVDLKGLAMSVDRVGLRVFKKTIQIDQDYYPEALGKLFIINAPWVFFPLWRVVQFWLDPNTKKKFEVLGTDYQDKLLQCIDAESLPVEYGGKCACDPVCVSVVKPYVPPSSATSTSTAAATATASASNKSWSSWFGWGSSSTASSPPSSSAATPASASVAATSSASTVVVDTDSPASAGVNVK